MTLKTLMGAGQLFYQMSLDLALTSRDRVDIYVFWPEYRKSDVFSSGPPMREYIMFYNSMVMLILINWLIRYLCFFTVNLLYFPLN